MDELEFWAEVDSLFHAAMIEHIVGLEIYPPPVCPRDCEGCDYELYELL